MRRRFVANRPGFLTLEAVAATLIVIEVMTLFALFMTTYVRNSDMVEARQRAVLAAEAVMNEIRGGHEPSAAEFAARYTGMSLEVERKAGTETWAGCTRVCVRVTARARNGSSAPVQILAYVRTGAR